MILSNYMLKKKLLENLDIIIGKENSVLQLAIDNLNDNPEFLIGFFL